MPCSKEEVFTWFKGLSGPKRIELMCGLMSMCIPLEIRYFETVIQDLAKKEFNSFREAESKANSIQELDLICKCDLLSEKVDYDESEMNGNGDGSSSGGSSSTDNNQKLGVFQKFPSRSKLIISLCLMQPTNTPCSKITYNAIRQQLTPVLIYQTACNIFPPKNCSVDIFFSEIMLLLTMAVYHPAFTYEQRDLLMKQKDEVEGIIEFFNTQIRSNALVSAAAIGPTPAAAANALTVTGVQQAQSGQAAYANPSGGGGGGGVGHPHNTAAHTQQASQPVHSYHTPAAATYPGQHSSSAASSSNKQTHQPPLTHMQPSFSMFIKTPLPTNIYPQQTAQSQSGQVVTNQMSILRINSPPSIASTSPSPTISPSSAKMTVPHSAASTVPAGQPSLTIKLDGSNMYSTTGMPPVITFVGDAPGSNAVPPQGIPFMNQVMSTSPHTVIMDDVQKTTSSSNSSTSCYNCGSGGHRGTECTSGVEDNR